MKHMHWKRTRIFRNAATLLAAALALVSTLPVQAEAVSPYDLISEVNSLRTANGLPALQTDAILMSTAQATAEIMAANGSCGHIGDVRGRVMAAGYGGSAGAWATENISCGVSKTLQSIVHSDWADDMHMIPMVNPSYQHIGAGVAVVNDYYYYVVHAAYPAGGSYASPPGAPTSSGPTAAGTPSAGLTKTTTSGKVVPVYTVTPQEDGSILHVVQAGQSLWSIAIAYGVKIADIQTLNQRATADNSVFIGQKLYVRGSSTPTISPTITNTPRPPTRTPRPSSTPHPPTLTPTEGPSPTHTSRPLMPGTAVDEPAVSRSTLGYIIIGVCAVGLLAMLFSSLRMRR